MKVHLGLGLLGLAVFVFAPQALAHLAMRAHPRLAYILLTGFAQARLAPPCSRELAGRSQKPPAWRAGWQSPGTGAWQTPLQEGKVQALQRCAT